MTTADVLPPYPPQPHGQEPPARRSDPVVSRAAGTRRASTITTGVALVAGLTAGGVASALASSRPATQDDGAIQDDAATTQDDASAQDARPGGDRTQDQGQDQLLGPGASFPNGTSGGS